MRISWNWLSEMADLSSMGGPKGLGELLTRRGLEVESIESQNAGLAHVVTGKILEKGQHPQADRLSLCKVTLGSGEPLEIVCGAQNHKAGDIVVVAQVGAHLPNGLKIAAGKIRGVVSHGMLCSEAELGLKAESEGILILPPKTELGRPIADVLGRNDHILTLKVTANRADCLSHWGIAREVSASLGKKPCRPEPKLTWDSHRADATPRTGLEAGSLGPQFYGCLIEGVKIGPSPEWIIKRLEAVGARSINNVVDATNLVMFELGQPVHAYDASRLEGGALVVREARAGETLPLLDGSSVTLSGTELVISDDVKPVALAGVMGGGNSEVSDQTTRVYLEVAEFDPTTVRKSSSRHQKKSESSHRFERGIDPQGLEFAMRRLASLVLENAGGKVVGMSTARKTLAPTPAISLEAGYCAEFLGMPVEAPEVEKVLSALGCELKPRFGGWEVTPPSFRLDLRIREDLAEEVARCLGFERIPSEVPALTDMPTSQASDSRVNTRSWMDRAKDRLVSLGFNEVVNYSFTSTRWLQELGLVSTVKVMNPLSEEHEWMVPSLVPGLLANVVHNTRHRFGSESQALRLFEIRPTFHTSSQVGAVGEDQTGVDEKWRLSFVVSGPRQAQALRAEEGEVDFYDCKAVFEGLIESMGARGVRLQPLSSSRGGSLLAHLVHPGQAAEIIAGNQGAGVLGLLHPKFARQWKLRAPVFLCEVDFDALVRMARPANEGRRFSSWPEYPGMERDFALVVKSEVSGEKLTAIALKVGKPLAKVAKIFDVYRGSQVAEGMTSIAVRVIFWEDTRSLQESETEEVSRKIVEAWRKEAGAELR
ncbi:MAG: phenylalanine--tRNA ligase subunit beta [Bdellovibrionales bacterium]|nr:phenylalanine--tRNA ligase subunit beta [Bdellovibrionales bacterium]